jgi:magnesium transporter
MPRTRLYRNGVLEAEDFPVADVSHYVDDPSCVVWFDLCRPAPGDLAVISEELGLHALAVEDVLHARQRPKLDIYDSHRFLSVYAVRLEADARLDTTEIDVFVTGNAVVTVRENDRFDIEQVVRRWDASPSLARHGVAFLLHGLLDYVVDDYFDIIAGIDGQVEDLEEQVFDDESGSHNPQRQTFELRKNLVQFRRLLLPMREVLNTLLRRDLHIVEHAMAPYYQDVYDHVLRVTEWTESLRERVGNIRETHLTQQGFQANNTMKKVTSWAAIIAVPTMITGFYGQNVPYPGSQQPIGFWTSTVLTAVASVTLYLIFRKRRWL